MPEPDPPALPASHLTSLASPSPMELRPSTQFPPKATITFYPLLLPLVLALKSDTSVRPSQWNFNQPPNSTQHLELDSSNVGGSRPVQMNEVLPPLDIIQRPSSSASAIQTSFSSGSIPHPVPFAHTTSQGNPSSFLSPDFAVSLRRARSDGGGGT